jgi:homoserine O-acetyltransferase
MPTGESSMTLLPETRGTEASQVAFSTFPEPRARLTAQRSTRRLQLSPKYGSGPREVEVSYLWCGAAGAPTVIVQGGISADRDVTALDGDVAPGWWQALVGSGAAIDLERWRVLAIDWLTPDQLGAGSVSSEDQADALAALERELGIAHARAFSG